MQSPLGKYAPIVAALVAISVIAVALFLHATASPDDWVDALALLAFGALFGSAATSNGTHAELKALHARIDAYAGPGTPPGPPP